MPSANTLDRGRRRTRRLLLATLLALALAMLIGYAVAGDVVPTPGGVYVEGVVGAPRYLNPLLAEPGSPDDDLAALVFAGLTRLGSDGRAVPDLALEWTVGAEGRQYTFRLRSDVLWHDGQPFRAQDVLATVAALQDDQFPGDPALAAMWRDIAAVAVPDGVRFTLPAPNSWFPEQASLGLLPAHRIDGLHGRALLEAALNMRPVGTGPFQVVEADLRRIQLAAHLDYHRVVPYIRGVDVRFFGTVAEAADALRRDELVALRPLPSAEAPAVPPRVAALQRPERAKTVQVLFNTRAVPLSDLATRAALAAALDRTAIARVAGPGAIPVTLTVPQPSTLNPQPSSSPASVHQPSTINHQLTLVTLDSPESIAVAEELARQWSAIGARVDVQAVGWTGMIGDVLAPGRFQVALIETFDPVPNGDPGRFWRSDAPFNFGGWSNPTADALLDRARASTRPADRDAAVREFWNLFAAEAPAAPLYHPGLTYLAALDLRGHSVPALHLPRDRFATFADWFLFTRRAPGRF